MLKRVLLAALAVALLVPVGLAGVWAWGQITDPVVAQTSESASDYSPAQIITVVGQGTTRIEPDIASASVGVETSAPTISEAVQENEAKMASILSALEEAGMASKDIQTTNYSVSLDRSPEMMPRLPGAETEAEPVYRVSNNVSVVIRDLGSVGSVLDTVIEAGANSIWGVNFGLDDSEAARAEARADAMADAESRAQALANLSRVELGPVMAVSEVIGGASPMPVVMAERLAAGGGNISPGELEVSYQVQVSYFIQR